MGFCRTNLFKRLESGGPAFIQSLERHTLRNFVFLYAIENGKPLPIGTQGAELLDAKVGDQDIDDLLSEVNDDAENNEETEANAAAFLRDEDDFRQRAKDVYERYATELRKRFKWLAPTLFVDAVRQDLLKDSHALLRVIKKCGVWEATNDANVPNSWCCLRDVVLQLLHCVLKVNKVDPGQRERGLIATCDPHGGPSTRCPQGRLTRQ